MKKRWGIGKGESGHYKAYISCQNELEIHNLDTISDVFKKYTTAFMLVGTKKHLSN